MSKRDDNPLFTLVMTDGKTYKVTRSVNWGSKHDAPTAVLSTGDKEEFLRVIHACGNICERIK